MGPIALLTDFGTRDGYAGVLHGVILCINPAAVIVDVCHDIPAQDIRAGAFVLSTVYRYFPEDTIHLVIVDPGVGSERRAIAVRTAVGTFVAPDNGVLSYVFAREPVRAMVQLTEPRYWRAVLSHTFHGRDLFAPVAAHLSLGVELAELGPAMQDPVRFTVPQVRATREGNLHGEVLHVDRFGNLVTNVPAELVPAGQLLRLQIAGRELRGVRRAYAHASDGELLVLVGSSGYLEVAVRNGSAADTLGTGRGTEVELIVGS